jgi:hypothetical protein
MAKTKITDVDKGWKKHGRAVKQGRRGPHVIVGILQGEAGKSYKDGATSIEVATIHEFGLGNMPERSFIRATFDKNERIYQNILNKFQRPVLLGTTSAKAALTILGLKVQSDTLAHMRKGIDPDKVDGKKARLKDTGQLYGDIQFEVNA